MEPLKNWQVVTTRPTEPHIWSGAEAVPSVGASVHVTLNGLGPGTVRGYFLADGERRPRYLGVAVELSRPPAWWSASNPNTKTALVFGSEITQAGV